MTSKALKWIAIITMTIDHIGLYLVPADMFTLIVILRGIGRLAFPLFAFFIAEGFRHTHDLKKYLFRLLGFAIVVQIFLTGYYFVSGENYMVDGNVFWPLVFGLVAVMLVNERKTPLTIIAFSLVIIADLIGFPYGGYGVLFILIFSFVRKFEVQLGLAFLVSLVYIAYPIAFVVPGYVNIAKYYLPVMSIQWLAMLSFIPIRFYNGRLGNMKKYFFYIYYPVHLGVIFAISMFL